MQNKQTSNKLSGFSLVEVIVVMAALAVIVSLSFGDIGRMFERQYEEQEKIDLQNIKKAMEVYAKKEGKLPTNTSLCDLQGVRDADSSDMWTIQLAQYSEMSADRMCFDQWGNERHYLTKEVKQSFRGGDYQYRVYFSSVSSEGSNEQQDLVDWANVTGLNGFVEFDGDSTDDFVIKYTDNQRKLELYEETLRRIELLDQHLERYARAKRYYAVAADVKDFDNYIMFPKDANSTDAGNYLEDSVDGVESGSGVETIEEEFKATKLAKVLGIPEYLGTNAITGKPLWYISNPGPDRTIPCSGSRSSAPFFPPAIIVTTDDKKPAGC